ncbi:MAG: RNA polymerase factor sigma-54 [Planctomycetales bacterium]|nr:RNA polymerase factor sigma-54 [Planctomycetales bacterium]
MRLETTLQHRQELRMRLAPQIIQSIEILQLPILDLQGLIQQELQENPLLEEASEPGEEPAGAEASESGEAGETAETPAGSTEAPEEPPRTPAEEAKRKKDESFERLVEAEEDDSFGEYFGSPRGPRESEEERDRKLEAMQNTAAKPASLPDYLYMQLTLRDDLDERTRELGREIVYNMDASGYLRYPLEEIFDIPDAAPAAVAPAPAVAALVGDGMATAPGAEAVPAPTSAPAPTAAGGSAALTAGDNGRAEEPPPAPPPPRESRTRCMRAEAEHALRVVQQLEPRGVGCRNQQECLLLQLDLTDPDYALKHSLLTVHLEDVLKNRIPKIVKETGFTVAEINCAIEGMRNLSLRPGSEYAPESPPFVRPDVVVEPDGDDYLIRLEDDYLPPLRINGQYRRMLREGNVDPTLKDFIRKKLEAARWLIDSIEQRRNTLIRVSTEIVKRQKPFLDHGITHHQPLKMQEVADALGIHVSTVSRAISAKWVQTHRGVYPLKYFFTGGTQTADGGNASRVSIKDRVDGLVKAEDRKNPLSDDELTDKLKAEGYNIARRTVTKYRKMLKIASSRQRKQF